MFQGGELLEQTASGWQQRLGVLLLFFFFFFFFFFFLEGEIFITHVQR